MCAILLLPVKPWASNGYKIANFVSERSVGFMSPFQNHCSSGVGLNWVSYISWQTIDMNFGEIGDQAEVILWWIGASFQEIIIKNFVNAWR